MDPKTAAYLHQFEDGSAVYTLPATSAFRLGTRMLQFSAMMSTMLFPYLIGIGDLHGNGDHGNPHGWKLMLRGSCGGGKICRGILIGERVDVADPKNFRIL